MPQADRLEDVVKTVELVAAGIASFQEIAAAIDKGDRQGRYYRLAAEDIGLIANQQNNATLTPQGIEFLASSEAEKLKLLEEQVLENPVFRESLMFIASSGQKGVTREELVQFLIPRVDLEDGVVDRRTATILNWLEFLQLIQRNGDRAVAKRVPGKALIQTLADPTKNVFTPTRKLKPYEKKLPGTSEKGLDSIKPISYTVDSAKLERANAEHERIVHLMAEKVARVGGKPTTDNVDVATDLGGQKFIFEMKTCTDATMHAQVRAAVGQLLEYRYQNEAPDAILVIVLSRPPTGSNSWLLNFLSESDFHVCWVTNSSFDCPAECAATIGPFMG
jgi:hypothetical protein